MILLKYSQKTKLDKKLRTEVRDGDKIEQERLKKKMQECKSNTQEKTDIYERNKDRLADHVTAMKDNQKKLNVIVTESQVIVEGTDYEPQEELRKKCKLVVDNQVHQCI